MTSGFDREAVQRKYAEERDRRVEGNRSSVSDLWRDERLAAYLDDPFTDFIERDPVTEDVDVAIVGAGIAGVVTGAKLKDQGDYTVALIDTAGGVGGTWYWNRYPGVMCDVESYIYMPMLEEMGYVPTRKYAFGEEIREHIDAIARKYGLLDDALFHTRVEESRWDDDAARWVITTDRGDTVRARYLVMAVGILNLVKLPAIPGHEKFRGKSFHASRWDYAYTGGAPGDDNLTNLADKVVGIIGTGATAVQCIPHLGASAKHLYVFQRTPSSVDVRNNRPTDPEWVKTLQPGWQQERMENFNICVEGGNVEVDLVQDGWTKIFRNLTGKVAKQASQKLGRRLTPQERGQLMELADYIQMNDVRARVDEIIEDPDVAERLKPWYRQFCKRPCFHDEYLPTFNRPNVTLVDTDGKGVERLTEDGVVVDGTEYKVDCLVFATGFEVGTNYTRRAGYDIIGRDGVTLSQKWSEGLRTLHGLQTNGFPNCFFLGFTQTAITVSVPMALNEQAKHVTYLMNTARDRGAELIECNVEAEDAWVAEIRRAASIGTRFYRECTPGYYNNEGKLANPLGLFAGTYVEGPIKFFKLLDEWRADGELQGVTLS